MKPARLLLFIALVVSATAWRPVEAQTGRVSDRDVIEAYHYFLARLLVLRQEHLDLKSQFRWNMIVHRGPPAPAQSNPDLDIIQSDAWIAVDPASCTVLELPAMKKRYYSAQVVNGWGETVASVGERNFPGARRFGLCLAGTGAALPAGTQRVDLPGRKARLVVRLEVGTDPAEAVKLQSEIKLLPTGKPKIEPAVEILLFENERLPRVEAFNRADAIIDSEADVNPGMGALRAKVRAVAKAARDVEQLKQIDEVIVKQAIPLLNEARTKLEVNRNGWSRLARMGDFGSDYLTRTVANLSRPWAASGREIVEFSTGTDAKGAPLDGAAVYTMTFPKGQRPESLARYFWSVTAIDSAKFQLIENPLKRHRVSSYSKVQPNKDGSVTIWFADKQPEGVPQTNWNWLPTHAGQNFQLMFRFYGPRDSIVAGQYFPPPLVRKN